MKVTHPAKRSKCNGLPLVEPCPAQCWWEPAKFCSAGLERRCPPESYWNLSRLQNSHSTDVTVISCSKMSKDVLCVFELGTMPGISFCSFPRWAWKQGGSWMSRLRDEVEAALTVSWPCNSLCKWHQKWHQLTMKKVQQLDMEVPRSPAPSSSAPACPFASVLAWKGRWIAPIRRQFRHPWWGKSLHCRNTQSP